MSIVFSLLAMVCSLFRMKIIWRIVVLGILVGLVVLAGKEYLGYHYFYKYENIRTKAKSIERSFPELEENLKKSVWFSKNPLFLSELAQLYLEMAFVENEFGTAEERDAYCDLAWESLVHLIKRNPVDASAYYKMGMVYMLYNFPLMTYIDKEKLYFSKALELKPADESLNLNIIYIYLTQWDFLNDKEKGFVYKRLGKMWKDNERFIPQLRNRWKRNFGNSDKLKEILSLDEELWLEIGKDFRP